MLPRFGAGEISGSRVLCMLKPVQIFFFLEEDIAKVHT